MRAEDIEIPYERDRGKRYRFFEALPGIITWTILLLPFGLSLINPTLTVFFIIAYLLLWFVKSLGMDIRAVQGLRLMQRHMKLNWVELLEELEEGKLHDISASHPLWHEHNVRRVIDHPTRIKPSEIYHAIIIATYKESREVLEPTFQSIIDSHFDKKKLIVILAYEERGGPEVEARAKELIASFGHHFYHAEAVRHPKDIPNEVIGKGGNITFAGRRLQEYVEGKGIDPLDVVVTTLDADNHPHAYYFAALTYMYSLCADPRYVSFQPIPLFTNNIWDAAAPMRVIATGNSFWNVVLSLRPHMLRNFSSHAQSLRAVIDTNFWSVRTIVEDGHQFWRTYFRYNGRHEVYPVYLPIYQDAVFANTYFKTLKAQFIQIRRWAWGASDVAYVADKGFFSNNEVPRGDLIMKFLRLLEGHITWAVAPLLLAFSAFIPALFNSHDYGAIVLPQIASKIETIALVGIVATLFLSLKTLPPKPARYKRRRTFWMLIQWVYLPLTTVVYNSFAALNSQTRLMFGWYVGSFDVTEKAVMTDDKKRVS